MAYKFIRKDVSVDLYKIPKINKSFKSLPLSKLHSSYSLPIDYKIHSHRSEYSN